MWRITSNGGRREARLDMNGATGRIWYEEEERLWYWSVIRKNKRVVDNGECGTAKEAIRAINMTQVAISE